ncbi:AraC family transcriptional regulator [Yoonia sp. SS1-5]|uniref:Helix-turn-helix domain-containing protein n=1 Tax=Yoonia rhodophyticola TaxID=3137370 RepID=A0AAN0MA94_9RHOB
MDTDNPAYMRWYSDITEPAQFVIYPDGCRDIILTTDRNGSVSAELTSFDFKPRSITLHPGQRMTGFRLRPGLCVDQAGLAGIRDEKDATDLIHDADTRLAETSAALAALGTGGATVAQVARGSGVSPRTLQRRFRTLGLPMPEFWRLLARARRAAIDLASDHPLVDIAGIHGYADQAHMSRACKYWFSHTPGQIRRNRRILSDINQPALGTWTGEQISIR